jgi:type II secretory pathway pseudopilin PulG
MIEPEKGDKMERTGSSSKAPGGRQAAEQISSQAGGYILIFLLIVIFVMTLGLLVAVPVLETQLKRENEEELIFRGQQYVEAIRLYQLKRPGSFPQSLEELTKEKCLRRLYPDPVSKSGQWNLLLIPPVTASPGTGAQASGTDKLLVVTPAGLKKISRPQIVGVVSSSPEKSVRIYDGEEYYQKWLFYYGQAPGKKPQLIYQTAEK